MSKRINANDTGSHFPFGYPEPPSKGDCGYCHGPVTGPSETIIDVVYHTACSKIVRDKAKAAVREDLAHLSHQNWHS